MDAGGTKRLRAVRIVHPGAYRLLGPAVLALLTGVFFWKILFTTEYTWLENPDLAYQVLPWWEFQAREIHARRLPLWDPYHWAGQPLLAQGQPGAAYPLNWLLFALPLDNGALSRSLLHWYFALIHFLAALNCYLLCRDRGRTPVASVFAGALFAFGGYVGTVDWPQMLNGAIWAPLVFLFQWRSIEGRNQLASAVTSGFFLGFCWLSGHHQAPLFISLAWVLFWLLSFVGWGPHRRLFGAAALSLLCAALTSGLQTLPAYEYGRLAKRWVSAPEPVTWEQKVPYSVHREFSLPPSSLIGIVLPMFLKQTNPFLGVAGAAAAVSALLIVSPRPWPFAVLAASGLVLALGAYTPIHGLLYAFMPMVDKARSPSMAIILFSLGAAGLAARGLDALQETESWRRLVLLSRACLIYGLSLLGLLVGFSLAGKAGWDERWTLSALAALGLAWLLYFRPSWVAPAVLAISIWELSLVCGYAWPSRYDSERAIFLRHIPAAQPVAEYLRSLPQLVRVEVDADAVPFNFGDVFGISQSNGYLASLTKNITELETHTPRTQSLLAVTHFVGRAARRPEQQLVFEAGELRVFKNPDVLPRVRLLHRLQQVPDMEAMRRFIADPKKDLAATGAMTAEPPELEECLADERVEIERWAPGEVALRIRAGCRAMLVLAETYYPGWRARMDGRKTEVYEMYGCLRGVVVERGEHRVELRYEPLSVWIGGVCTAIGFVLQTLFLGRVLNHN